jgi:hypothetical protein
MKGLPVFQPDPNEMVTKDVFRELLGLFTFFYTENGQTAPLWSSGSVWTDESIVDPRPQSRTQNLYLGAYCMHMVFQLLRMKEQKIKNW